MPYDPNDERERTPWQQRRQLQLPKMPTTFEGRLLFIGGALLVLETLQVARSFASELHGLLMWPIDASFAIVRWVASWL